MSISVTENIITSKISPQLEDLPSFEMNENESKNTMEHFNGLLKKLVLKPQLISPKTPQNLSISINNLFTNNLPIPTTPNKENVNLTANLLKKLEISPKSFNKGETPSTSKSISNSTIISTPKSTKTSTKISKKSLVLKKINYYGNDGQPTPEKVS